MTVTDENGHATVYDYQAFGRPDDRRLAAVTDADLNITSYGYDPVFGALATVTAPISQGDRSFTYVSGLTGCANGFLDTETHPESGTTSYEHNCLGLVTRRTRPGVETTTWDYDHAGRMTAVNYPDSAGTVSMSYDGAGRRTSLSNPWASTDYLYDDAGRLETMTISIVGGPTAHEFGYTYDTLDRLETVTYPSGRIVTSGWDDRNWLTSLTGAEGSGVEYLSSITYLNTGLPDVVTFANGVTTDQGIDDRNRLNSIVTSGPGGQLINMGLRYDPASNVEFWDDNLNILNSRQFGYDTLNRLTSASASGLWGTLGYTYDELGNRLTRTVNGNTAVYTYEASTNRLTGLTGAEVRTFEYDDVGRMTTEDRTQATALLEARDPDEIFSDGFETGDTRYWANGSGSTGYFEYTFNAADQLTGVLNGPNIAGSYSYDGDGLRVAVDDGQGGMLYYLRGPDGNTLAEYDDMGSLVAEYLYAGGRQIGKVVPDGSGGDEVRYFHADHLGSALVITDDAGSVTWTGDYYPFGEPFSSSGTPDRYRFTQHELDFETGLFYAKARYYHPHIGRFLTTDPVGGSPAAPQSWNRYAYVEDNPLKFVDPDGETLTLSWTSESDLTQITTGIYRLTGLVLSVDQGGTVSVAGDSYSSGRRKQASGVARSLILEAVGSDEDFSVSLVRADKKTTLGKAVGRKVTIDMADSVSSQSIDTRTMDPTMTLFHELLHSVRDTVDVDNSHSDPGQTVPIVNLIRDRAGLSRRTSYFYTATGQHTGELQFDGGTVDFENK